MITLYPYQKATVEFGIKSKYAILALEVGLGKTICALTIGVQTESKMLICCPSYLRFTWLNEIKKWFPHLKAEIYSTKKQIKKPTDNNVVIVSYGIIEHCDCLFEWADLVIADECFHEDTLIDTHRGLIPIKNIVVGDLVKNCLGYSSVLEISSKRIKNTMSLVYNGKKIHCSLNHPFLTSNGWVMSGKLKTGDLLVRTEESMRLVQSTNGVEIFSENESFLRKELFSEMENVSKGNTRESLQSGGIEKNKFIESWEKKSKYFCSHETKEPYAFKRNEAEGISLSEENGTQAKSTRWKWLRSYRTRKNSFILFLKNALEFLRAYKAKTGKWFSSELQNRLGVFRGEDSDRSGWKFSRTPVSKKARCKENEFSRFYRVESVEIQKQGSLGEFEDGYFYDLRVGGHPSFTINGVLVHNCHNLKSMQAKRTEAFHRLVYENNIKRLLLLTGTPILNRVYEFYSLIALCNYNPEIKDSTFLKRFKSYVVFADHFSHRREFQMMVRNRRIKVVNWDGFKNVDELKTILKGIYIKFKAKDVLQDLPDKVFKDVLISNSEDKDLLAAFELMQSQDGMDRIQPTIKAISALSKVPFTVEYAKELLESVDKVIIYTDHVEAALALGRALRVKAITGATPMPERQRIANAFQNESDKILVATYGSFSTGITLTACSNMILNDMNWVPGVIEQAIGRILRIGQRSNCVIHRIFGSFTDQYISEKLGSKEETIKKVT
jgi:hypothetical protein